MNFWIGSLLSVLIIWAGIHSLRPMKDWFALSVSEWVKLIPGVTSPKLVPFLKKEQWKYPYRNIYFAQGTRLENLILMIFYEKNFFLKLQMRNVFLN